LLDEECACDERAVRKQCSGRKMSVLDLARRSARTHLPVFAHFPFKYHRPAPVDDDHLERWAALPRFVWPDETHHFVSQSTGDVPVAHGPCRFLPLVLDSCAKSAAGAFHVQALCQTLGSTWKKARSFIQATRPGRRAARTLRPWPAIWPNCA